MSIAQLLSSDSDLLCQRFVERMVDYCRRPDLAMEPGAGVPLENLFRLVGMWGDARWRDPLPRLHQEPLPHEKVGARETDDQAWSVNIRAAMDDAGAMLGERRDVADRLQAHLRALRRQNTTDPQNQDAHRFWSHVQKALLQSRDRSSFRSTSAAQAIEL